MTHHLTPAEVEGYVAGTLSDDERVGIAAHVGECRDCQAMVTTDDRLTRRVASLRRRVEDSDDHPEFETLVALAEHTLDPEATAPLERHLAECEQCAEDLADLARAQDEVAAARRPAPAPAGTMIWDRTMTIAAAAAVLAAIAAAIWFVTRPSREAAVPQRAEAASPATERVIVDAALGRVALDATGRVSGLDRLSAADAALVTSALATGTIDVPATLASLQPAAGPLMGAAPPASTFTLVAPLGTVVESEMPEFSWQAAPGATRYRVSVFDDRLNLVADSGPIKTPVWTPSKPLVRNRDYSWQVHATTSAGVILAPGTASPEARFRVLDEASLDVLTRARQQYGTSPLAMGVLDAHFGLLDAALREFDALQRANPGSSLAEGLLRGVQAARRH